MSIPISTCLVVKAANGDEKAYGVLKGRMATNLRRSGFSVWGCEHKPPCEASEEKLAALDIRLAADLENDAPPVAGLSAQQVYTNLASTECLSCGGGKRAKQSFCRLCFYKLPKLLRTSLYDPTGYADTFNSALLLLKPAEATR